jgi:hypothetical protein
MTLSNNGLAINVDLKGNQNWNGGVLLLSAAANLQAGYFTDLTEQGRRRQRPGGRAKSHSCQFVAPRFRDGAVVRQLPVPRKPFRYALGS